jgi:hypothetical protein
LRIIAKHYGKLISPREIRETSETTWEGSGLVLSTTIEPQLEGVKVKPKNMFLKESTFYLAAPFDDEHGFLIFANPF